VALRRQRHIATTLARLSRDLKQSGLASPSVIVVGDVISALAQAAEHPEVRRSA
jgi:uroporphyrin-III C-methyltransferase